MTDSADPAAPTPPAPSTTSEPREPGRKGTRRGRPPGSDKAAGARGARVNPVLETLAGLYPHLFGEVFRPLKRGIFQDLLQAHPELLERDSLKEALAQHTRSSRYLVGVAAGQQRHDLAGQAVEAMAPEHVYQALLEVFKRRQGRGGEDLRPKLVARVVQAFEQSGLTREEFVERVHGRDEAANAVLDEAMAIAAQRIAKDEALMRAFKASGQPADKFADMYGLDVRDVQRMLKRLQG